MSPRTSPARRLAVAALATILSLGTAPAHAAQAPASERDLAYELGVQAEAAGDLPRAAAAYERAYRLTAPAETGPRLLFLRASVAARLRADDGTPPTRVQLCHAEAVLRDYLADASDISPEEHANLGRIDQRLALAPGPDCATLLGPPPPPPATVPDPVVAPPTTSPPAPQPTPTPATPIAPSTRRTPGQRALLATGTVSLGIGVAALAVMGAGIQISRRANERGLATCREDMAACTANDTTVRQIVENGRFGAQLTRIGAVVGGLALVTGITLIVVGEHLHRRPRVALTPQLAPGTAGLTLSGRF